MKWLPQPGPGIQKYDITKSYDWNYQNAPPLPNEYICSSPTDEWQLCGVRVNSPVAIAAGPLLNGRWVLHYAALGFDVLTYKTVRRSVWPCYPLPNLQPVKPTIVDEPPSSPMISSAQMMGSWAVSFGMPSSSPDLWRFDVEETRRLLPAIKKLSVSVVATPEPDWTLEQVADDYAKCATWAVESGADFVELNFSCPNVSTCDGQLYQDPESAAFVARDVRQRIGSTPLLLKIGYVGQEPEAKKLASEVAGLANGLVMINCIPSRVQNDSGLLFDGQKRGIAGSSIRSAVVDQVAMFTKVIREIGKPLEVIGVGGIATEQHVAEVLRVGAAGCQVASAVMIDA